MGHRREVLFVLVVGAVTQAQACGGSGGHSVRGQPLAPAGASSVGSPGVAPVDAQPVRPRTLALGRSHGCALRAADGGVWCWGHGLIGSYESDEQEPRTPYLLTVPPMVELASDGDAHVCGRTAEGAVWCWGSLNYPIARVDIPPVVRFEADRHQFCAIVRDGSVWCWPLPVEGRNDYRSSWKAAAIVAGVSDAVELMMGTNQHGTARCARRRDKRVFCWDSKLELDLRVPRQHPIDTTKPAIWPIVHGQPAVERPDLAAFDKLVFRGAACGFDRHGRATCFPYTEPISLAPLEGRQVEQFDLQDTSCMLADGTLSCWGNPHGKLLGHDSCRAVDHPVRIADDVREFAVRASFACLRKRDDTVWCWGWGSSGQLGDGGRKSRGPGEVPGLDDAKDLQSTDDRVCALRGSGELWCWGGNCDRLLDENTAPWILPRRVPGLPLANAFSLGSSQLCVQELNGELLCRYGEPNRAQLHVDVKGVRKFSAEQTSCAIDRKSQLWCWDQPKMEDPPIGSETLKAKRIGGVNGLVDVQKSSYDAYALRIDGQVYHWLDEPSEEEDSQTPRLVEGIRGASAIALGTNSDTLCVKRGFQWRCNPYNDRRFYVISGFDHADQVSLSLNVESSCWLRRGKVYCGGEEMLAGVAQLVGSPETPCARTIAGKVQCWGYRGYKLGTGELSYATTPVRVDLAAFK